MLFVQEVHTLILVQNHLQSKIKAQSENTHWTLRKHKELNKKTPREHLENTQSSIRKHPEITQKTPRSQSENTQRTLREHRKRFIVGFPSAGGQSLKGILPPFPCYWAIAIKRVRSPLPKPCHPLTAKKCPASSSWNPTRPFLPFFSFWPSP